MPSESRTEPTLEELSAYLDHELDPSAQARVAEHVAGCADCQARLDGLRQTAYAIRGLPMESPPRTFTVPAAPRRQWRWAPVGWVASAAAAMLVIVFGATHLHFSPAGSATTSGGGTTAQYSTASKAAAPLSQYDQHAGASQAYSAANAKTVAVPNDSSRSLTIGTDARTYPANGILGLHIATSGISSREASSVRIFLTRERGQGGYAIRLAPPTSAAGYPLNYGAAYSIPQLPLAAPVAGDYTVMVEVDLSNGSSLITWLPVTITP
jgi:hypothetical protein